MHLCVLGTRFASKLQADDSHHVLQSHTCVHGPTYVEPCSQTLDMITACFHLSVGRSKLRLCAPAAGKYASCAGQHVHVRVRVVHVLSILWYALESVIDSAA